MKKPYFGSLRAKLIIAPLGIAKISSILYDQYNIAFVQILHNIFKYAPKIY